MLQPTITLTLCRYCTILGVATEKWQQDGLNKLIVVKQTAGGRRRYIFSALICLLAGLVIFVYRGPGWVVLRYYVGDVIAVAFLYFGLSAMWNGPVLARIGAITAIAVAIEFAQLLKLTPKDDSLITEIIFGSSFDPIDFLAYAIGLIAAYASEWWFLSKRHSA